jgi:hypothetical protein
MGPYGSIYQLLPQALKEAYKPLNRHAPFTHISVLGVLTGLSGTSR